MSTENVKKMIKKFADGQVQKANAAATRRIRELRRNGKRLSDLGLIAQEDEVRFLREVMYFGTGFLSKLNSARA